MNKRYYKRRSFNKTYLLLSLLALAITALGSWIIFANKTGESSSNTARPSSIESSSDQMVAWEWAGDRWSPYGDAPSCPTPLTFEPPADLFKATSVLYPGQTRNLYKPHGGFAFDTSANEDITVTAPYDAYLISGSRYIEGGEVQYILDFQLPCGIMYRFDHLLTLAPRFKELMNQLPEPQPDDSRGHKFSEPVLVNKGNVIATAVGRTSPQNVGFDFGVYDLRTPNGPSQSAAYQSEHQAQASQAFYGVCWLSWFDQASNNLINNLPSRDQKMGKTSDYC